MQQQEQVGGAPGAPEPGPERQDPPQRSRDEDGTWGLGSAAAMDMLRRRNFRGSRQPRDDGPSSE